MIRRREFLAGLAALGAAVGCGRQAADAPAAQTSSTPAPPAIPPLAMGRRIDVHHHFMAPSWRAAMIAAKVLPEGREWTADRALEVMDRGGVETAMLSLDTGIYRLGPQKRQALMMSSVREFNEYGAKVVADHPRRFGLWALLPLPNIAASLKEIEYALDTLKAAGIGIDTSWGDKYIGDPEFAPVLEELNRRRAIVYSHPSPVISGRHEFPREEATTRNILSVLNDAAPKFPNITFLFSHAGGTVPMIIQRIVGRETAANLDKPAPPNSELALLRKFYYDTAAAFNAVAMGALKKVVGASQILFGTDFLGGTDLDQAKHIAEALYTCGVFTPEEVGAIERGNALRFLPQYQTT